MTSYITKGFSWLRCLLSFLAASGLALLLCFLLDGPRLGPLYDFLLSRRPQVPLSRELLIIDVPGHEFGEDILDPGTASALLYIMTELGAANLIIQIPVLGLSAGTNASEAEILHRFDEEFSILSRNIQNLFDAIRTGSIAPRDSARYVGELVTLSSQGKERLVSTLVLREAEGLINMERAAAFFGHARRPGDLRVQLVRAGTPPWDSSQEISQRGVLPEEDAYSRARRDRDGVLRRISPLITVPELYEEDVIERNLEHIIYRTLKTRFPEMFIEGGESKGLAGLVMGKGPLLIVPIGPGSTEIRDRLIPLDKSGAILFETPRRGEDFRRIGISEFLAYEEADRNLRRMLAEAEALGFFGNIQGEIRPDLLYDYALSLREEFSYYALNGGAAEKYIWIEARNRYFSSLEDFLTGPTEMNMIRVYEEIIADIWGSSGSSDWEQRLDEVTEMRNSLILAFAELRAARRELLELREKLDEYLADSFCILGSDQGSAFSSNLRLTDVEASALLANSILTGRVIRPGPNLYLLAGSLVSAFIICFFIKSLGAASVLGMGIILSLLFGAGFSLAFVLTGIWLDPLVPMGSGAGAVFISFLWALIAKSRYAKGFRLAYGPFVSRACLKSLIRAGRPLPSQSQTIMAAVVFIKNSDPAFRDNSPFFFTREVLNFQEKLAAMIKKAGAVIVGFEDDAVIACFGSPLERTFIEVSSKTSPYNDNVYANTIPAMKAADMVSDMARQSGSDHWHFGLDMGFCSFAWSAQTGYFALGLPVQRAKLLANSAGHYKTQVLISSAVNEALPDVAVKKMNRFKNRDGSPGEYFYSLAVKD